MPGMFMRGVSAPEISRVEHAARSMMICQRCGYSLVCTQRSALYEASLLLYTAVWGFTVRSYRRALTYRMSCVALSLLPPLGRASPPALGWLSTYVRTHVRALLLSRLNACLASCPKINDDYCDCSDGMDETLTPACSHAGHSRCVRCLCFVACISFKYVA